VDDQSSSVSNQIDVICDEFEAEFRQGTGARIENYLTRLQGPARARLLVELVALEWNLYREAGVTLAFEGYLLRFPEFAKELAQLRQELDSEAAQQPGGQPPEGSTMPVTLARVKHFVLRAILGQGGFGTVWRAFDTRLHREVALKIPRKDRLNQLHIALMLREARAAAGLKHSHIVPVHEVGEGEDESACYIVTGLIEGPTLKNWVTQHQLTYRQTAELVATIARALQHAHECKVVHRDLKPANILMDAAGAPHLADFGLAKRVDREDSLSIDGQLVGTPNYMSPEQARGDHQAIDHRTDIYSLGVILYELLTGQPPFKGELAWLLEQIARTAPPPPLKVNPTVPEDLEKICLKCLEKDPRARYQSASDVADELHRYLTGESLRGVPVPLQRRIRKWFWRRRRLVTALTSTAVLSLSLAGGIWWWSQPPSQRRWVKFETDPPRCKITVVRLDPQTGEPNPDDIEDARGETPLKMRLLPGDYLVVAVLNERRFHEVLRHVPNQEEGVPTQDLHYFWRIDDSGCINYHGSEGHGVIKIPRPDVTLGMGFVEGATSWIIPKGLIGVKEHQRISMPGFFVELTDRRANRDKRSPSTQLTSPRFGPGNGHLERLGMRMPSIKELAYLQSLAMVAADGDPPGEHHLADGKVVHGLSAEPWEWTHTRVKTGAGGEPLAGLLGLYGFRAVACGKEPLEPVGNHPQGVCFTQAQAEWIDANEVGVRGVRSAQPRLRPEDFIRPVLSR